MFLLFFYVSLCFYLRDWTAHNPKLEALLSLVAQSFVQLFATRWTVARQASLSFTNSWSLLELISIDLVMPSSHLRSSPSPPAFNLSQHHGLFQ